MTILVVGEIQKGVVREASYELITLAKKIGGEIKGLIIGSGIGADAESFAKKGAGHVYMADDAALANYNVDGYTRAIKAAVKASGASTVLISNTPSGWDVAARVAAGLDAAFVSDAFNFADGAFVRRVFNVSRSPTTALNCLSHSPRADLSRVSITFSTSPALSCFSSSSLRLSSSSR